MELSLAQREKQAQCWHVPPKSSSYLYPSVGPRGSALCVYPADNTVETGGDGHSESAFDIFREDLTSDSDTTTLVMNTYVEVSMVEWVCVVYSVF